MADISSYTIPVAVQRLLRGYKKDQQNKDATEHQPKFKVSEAIGRVAFLYEKLRNAIDYREENLLVKSAILRILKRRFVPGVDPASITKPLLTELIHAGYVTNKTLPESRLITINQVLIKYANFLGRCIPTLEQQVDREETFDWVVTMAACEIEETLSASEKKRAMLEFIYLNLLERVDILSKKTNEDERKVQIYVAVLRGYARYDVDLTSYYLLTYFYPAWKEHDEATLQRVARNVVTVRSTINQQIHHPLQEKLVRQVKKIQALFLILADVFEQTNDPMALLQNPVALEEAITEETRKEYKKVKSKLRRTSLRSIIYLFVTKMAVAFVLEVPYDFIVLGHLNYIPLFVNVLFHPMLLFFIALLIHIPAKENTKKIIEGIKDLVYNYEGKEIVYRLRPQSQRGRATNWLFKLLYVMAFIITFGSLITLLSFLTFNLMSGFIFVMFLTLVSFFGLRVRQIAKDLVVLENKDNLASAMIDFFSIPIVRAGRWLSVNFAKYNFVVLFLDVIIEAPFKLILDVFDDWLGYIREKREQIYDN